jgi:LmbE family N-acetylglucosaminyl deacetylase
MNVLVIAPHPDDESIGSGGTICLHTQRKDRVVAVFLTSGELGLDKLPREEAWRIREAEARKAAKILGLAEVFFLRKPDWYLNEHVAAAAAELRPIVQAERPDLIYLPHPVEWHPDHQAALPILQTALLRTKQSPALRGYEIWTPLSEHDHVENISTVMNQKLRAIRCHRSQMHEFPYDRAIAGLNQYRGVIAAKAQFAEVFQTLSI